MIYTLPQFPLRVVIFPKEILPLHIFEDRYRQLIADCEDRRVPFGITPVIDGKLQDIGTKVRLHRIRRRYSDGRYDVEIEGLNTYRVKRFITTLADKLYSAAEVLDLTHDEEEDPHLSKAILELIGELYEMMIVSQNSTS